MPASARRPVPIGSPDRESQARAQMQLAEVVPQAFWFTSAKLYVQFCRPTVVCKVCHPVSFTGPPSLTRTGERKKTPWQKWKWARYHRSIASHVAGGNQPWHGRCLGKVGKKLETKWGSTTFEKWWLTSIVLKMWVWQVLWFSFKKAKLATLQLPRVFFSPSLVLSLNYKFVKQSYQTSSPGNMPRRNLHCKDCVWKHITIQALEATQSHSAPSLTMLTLYHGKLQLRPFHFEVWEKQFLAKVFRSRESLTKPRQIRWFFLLYFNFLEYPLTNTARAEFESVHNGKGRCWHTHSSKNSGDRTNWLHTVSASNHFSFTCRPCNSGLPTGRPIHYCQHTMAMCHKYILTSRGTTPNIRESFSSVCPRRPSTCNPWCTWEGPKLLTDS